MSVTRMRTAHRSTNSPLASLATWCDLVNAGDPLTAVFAGEGFPRSSARLSGQYRQLFQQQVGSSARQCCHAHRSGCVLLPCSELCCAATLLAAAAPDDRRQINANAVCNGVVSQSLGPVTDCCFGSALIKLLDEKQPEVRSKAAKGLGLLFDV